MKHIFNITYTSPIHSEIICKISIFWGVSIIYFLKEIKSQKTKPLKL